MSEHRGAGGTPGGMGEFLIGLVTVHSGFWTIRGYDTFGLSLVPLIFGIGIVFFNGRSVLGWLLLVAGSVIILAGILMNLRIYFEQTSLFNTIVMLVLLFGGIGLMARAVKAHR
jgi:hypothetical protein